MVEPDSSRPRDAKPSTDLRKELARLMVAGENPLIAKAMVNRMWGQFFGYGFTKPLDDMGPHNPSTHPECSIGSHGNSSSPATTSSSCPLDLQCRVVSPDQSAGS
ncbi:MAG: hypothetical protein CM1200mP2_00880 [Planctomycetaceae bacterium]|nr:MAG: hypothetical protein CM1200mP2_00880 [Planctomycetaceae bacterium]